MKFFIYFITLVLLGLGIFLLQKNKDLFRSLPVPQPINTGVGQEKKQESVTVIAKNLDTVWEIAFLSNGNLLVTERKGGVKEIDVKNGNIISSQKIESASEIGEGGLMGVAIDPAFDINNYVYFSYTYQSSNKILNRVVRMKYTDHKLSNEEILVDNIPGSSNHNGGRIKFGPDGFLYITTGDAGQSQSAQDPSSLSGKILRLVKGEVEIYSLGHRNSQGIAWDGNNQMWATEHGRSGVQSGLDEINRIDQGKNYGWPEIEGNERKEGMETPILHSGESVTWAPSGLAFFKDSLYWGGLRGQALYKGTIKEDRLNLKEYFKNEFGRIRAVTLGPDNMLYISTSNLDGRGTPKEGDDKIIKIDPNSLI